MLLTVSHSASSSSKTKNASPELDDKSRFPCWNQVHGTESNFLIQWRKIKCLTSAVVAIQDTIHYCFSGVLKNFQLWRVLPKHAVKHKLEVLIGSLPHIPFAYPLSPEKCHFFLFRIKDKHVVVDYVDDLLVISILFFVVKRTDTDHHFYVAAHLSIRHCPISRLPTENLCFLVCVSVKHKRIIHKQWFRTRHIPNYSSELLCRYKTNKQECHIFLWIHIL